MASQMQARPSLRDIAQQLSVSVWTVSKAMNGLPGVGDAMRQRILHTAGELGYVPNRQAQTLRQGRSRCIGLLLPTLSNPVYSERMEDLYAAAEARGYEVLVTSYEQSSERRIRLCREMIGRRVEAVLLAGGWSFPLQSFVDAGIVTLLINPGSSVPPGVAALNVDRAEGARLALEHLLALGHRRPLLLGNWLKDAARMKGIRAALRQAGRAEDEFVAVSIGGDGWMQAAHEQTLAAFQNTARPPTAVMGQNDLVAMGALSALRQLGVSVPEDVSVTGMDNIAISQFYGPSLTTISQTHLQLGRRAVEMVAAMIEGQPPHDLRQDLKPKLVVRESTGPVPRRDAPSPKQERSIP